MTHASETTKRLIIRETSILTTEDLVEQARSCSDVCLLRLPASTLSERDEPLRDLAHLISKVVEGLGPESTLIVIGETIDLVRIHSAVSRLMHYQLWIAIKRNAMRVDTELLSLPEHHFGVLVYTRYQSSLRHTKTRIGYTYCPACDRTSKDYGGKKHTYHHFGTLISDVWRDLNCDLAGDITALVERFADLFGIDDYHELRVLDCRQLPWARDKKRHITPSSPQVGTIADSMLLCGDVLEQLRQLPDNSIDFAFADPPYNLKKKYTGYSDDLAIAQYFQWCDEWISELARVLKPGRTCAILNIPLWSIRHFLYMETQLQYQNWIAWDALSFPVRLIMPAHYAVLCFSKGVPRPIPGLVTDHAVVTDTASALVAEALSPMAEGYCLRADCLRTRRLTNAHDRGPLTDLWWDIHRLKHNSRRVDHPCQLPPHFMHRLISLFTQPGEIVLDPFNGAGTTTLTAEQLGRRFVGIELAEKYHKLAQSRHAEIAQGLDPFRKEERILTVKNSPVPRLIKQVYEIPKKTLQLEVRRVAQQLGQLPTRDEMIAYGKYPIHYYDEYFASWGEVCAAARTTGMSENRIDQNEVTALIGSRPEQLSLELELVETRD